MGRIGMPELFIILAIVVMIFGANRIPEIFKGVGKGIRNFKDATREEEAANARANSKDD
jgi:sec-independent protein translocase protein TatA